MVCHPEKVLVDLCGNTIESENAVELLGVTIDKNLNFTDHVTELCRRGNQKLHALARISNYLDKDKLVLIMKTFVTSQFNYCPLVWMFHNRTMNNKINRLHERALRIAYKEENLSFQELLVIDNSVTIHEKNLQKLATEMFRIKNHISPLSMTCLLIS